MVGGAPVSATCRSTRAVGQRLADLPRQGRGQGLGVDRVEVATGRQHVGGAAGGRPARPGRDVAARRGRRACCRPRRGWPAGRGRAGRRSTARSGRRVATGRGPPRRGSRGSGRGTTRSAGKSRQAGRPVVGRLVVDPSSTSRTATGGPVAAASASTRPGTRPRSCRPRGGARCAARTPGRRRPWPAATGTVPCGRRVMARTRSTSASPSGGTPEHVQAAADLGVLQRAQVAVDVQDHVVELVVGHGPVVASPRSRWISASTSRSHTWRRRAGSLPGSMAWAAGVGVEQRLEPGHVVGGLGPGHGRDQVVDDRRRGVRRLACVPSPGSLTTNGYTSGRSPRAASGRQAADRALALPGSHSSVPCLPTWTTASAPHPVSSQR